jgi:methionyl aminopeptidase
MIKKKTAADIAVLRRGGAILAQLLRELALATQAGVTTLDLDDIAQARCAELGVEPILLGYHPSFAPVPYPAAVCISVNDCVQHGIPNERMVLVDGDVVNIDMSIGYEGMVVDAGITVGVGALTAADQKLIAVTKEALARGVAAATAGNRIGDISYAIQSYVEAQGLSVVRDLCGHGVGYAIHEEPMIPNFGVAGKGPTIEVGHVYAIEPIVTSGNSAVYFDDDGDGYSVYTKDGSHSAHFEHSVAITKQGPIILTA